MLDYTKSFIETQFPVSKISKESYKERKAGASQTLTGLGKWWGRKPLILVRATLLGVLMPVSENPVKDREIFLKILTMDENGLNQRKNKFIGIKDIFRMLNIIERNKYFTKDSDEKKPVFNSGLTKDEKDYLQRLAFNRMSYDDKLIFCERPENVIIETETEWDKINSHLKTSASSIQELIKQLGIARFGHVPRVGDCFAGGGSIPFEAARIGAEVFASDLNPMASVLNWANLNILSMDKKKMNELQNFQERVFDEVLGVIEDLGIEKNEDGMIAKYYLYCTETTCPECGVAVPLMPSLLISQSYRTVARLEYKKELNSYAIKIISKASDEELKLSIDSGTVRSGALVCPKCTKQTPITSLRNDTKVNGKTNLGLRKWEMSDFVPKNNDIYRERLYCIKYIDKHEYKTWTELIKKAGPATDSTFGTVYYSEPSSTDIERENKVISVLGEHFDDWQKKGFLPSMMIESGYNTDQLIRERGWQYWHQLFNPRQLLVFGLFNEAINKYATSKEEIVTALLGLNKCIDWNSKLSIWNTARDVVQATFTNQSLNTLFNYASRGMSSIYNVWRYNVNNINQPLINKVKVIDARSIDNMVDIWISDPPYSDAVNYHELTEFFLAWDKLLIEKAFPDWYTDSKRVLAVKGVGQTFNESMIDVYLNLAKHMPDNGYQVVMFTHQDVKVWSELSMILWSAGLRVVSAWNIATETESGGLKSGNYVKGTVLLTLKKQTSNDMAFQDELYDEIKKEVKSIIDSMRDLDDKDDPDFTDADYLLASYAASLKVLTSYKEIEGVDVKYCLALPRDSKEENPIEKLINKAVRVAYDYLIPEGFDISAWKDLKPEERFYIRSLELEKNNNYKISAYQELARGFGVKDYTDMFAEFKANSARLKTPSEYRMSFLGTDGFGSTLLRHLLVAINETSETESTVQGRKYLRDVFKEDNSYWYKKSLMVEILEFISKIEYVDHMQHWKKHAYSAKLLKEALRNEGV